MSELDWYFNLEDGMQDEDLCDVNDKSFMYERLAMKMAAQMFDRIYDTVYTFAHEEESYFYGNNPTIWEQLKVDVEHGEFLNREQLEAKCNRCLEEYSELEIYLLWVYAFDQSSQCTVYDNKPELYECMHTITDIVLVKLYRAAEQEKRE